MCKVSIYVPCYNQKDFIGRNLDSILNQKVNFKYEIIVRDDCSTDGTREIIQEFAKKYPDIVKLYLEEENQYSKHKFMQCQKKIMSLCSGEYFAMLEGDDYWCDENKLQTQVDFLDSNPEFTGCFTKTLRKNVITNKDFGFKPSTEELNGKNVFTIEDTIKGYFICTASVMYRFKKYKEELLNTIPVGIINGDSYLIYFFSLYGKLKYLDRLSAIHTLNETGIWNSLKQSQDERNVKYWLEIINFPIEVRKLLDKFNCILPYETAENAMRRVLTSAINIKRFDVIEKASERFPEVFSELIKQPDDKSGGINYLKRKIKKYKKRNMILVILLFSFFIFNVCMFLNYLKMHF